MRSLVADGNFKANHLKQKNDNSDIWLTNGEGFMTNTDQYAIHLQIAKESKSVGIHKYCLVCLEFTNDFLSLPVVIGIGLN